jgi:hypothetical protein
VSDFPSAVRKAVKERQSDQCARCGATGAEHHHRMRRREGGHGKENVVYLCSTDHRWVHANPKKAQEYGFIIPIHVTDISAVPIKTFRGWALFTNDGDMVLIDDN